MALVTLTGLPSAGKTTRARELQALLRKEQPLPVVIVNDESLGLTKADYDGASPGRAS
jgi:tRNA uridine 5-carbamoylmethylation protein Kti12